MSDANSTTPLTNEQHIRLECIRAAYRHDRSPEDIIKRASDLSAFVVGGSKSSAPVRKKTGNGGQAEQDDSPI